jgi:hypothetical protein
VNVQKLFYFRGDKIFYEEKRVMLIVLSSFYQHFFFNKLAELI